MTEFRKPSILAILGEVPIEGKPPLYSTVDEIRTHYAREWGVTESSVRAERIETEGCRTPYVVVTKS